MADPSIDDPIKLPEAPTPRFPIGLPSELWLQILENVSDIEYLWTTVRPLSRTYKAYVERIVATDLSNLSISLSLPRHDPVTGSLRYRGMVPGAEVTLQYASLDGPKSVMTLTTPVEYRGGATMEQLNATNVLCKERLDKAAVWMWFGRYRGKGIPISTSKDIRWDAEAKVWLWRVEWKRLVSAYCEAKRKRRRLTQRN